MASKNQKLKIKCWKYFSLWRRLEGKNTCIQCGKKKDQGYVIQAGHVLPKTYGNVMYFNRHDVFAQCAGCNMFHSKDTKPFYDLFVAKFGQEAFDRLWRRRNKTVRWVNYEARIERYKKFIKKIEESANDNNTGAVKEI